MEPQPAPLIPERPFTVGEAQSRGLPRQRLRGKEVEGVSYGIYRPAGWNFELKEAARALCAASPGAWISHSTAARLHQLILPPWLGDSNDLHISRPRHTSGVRRRGIHAHKMTAFPDETELDGELRLSTRARTWLDMARVLSLADLVCMGDQLVRIPRAIFEDREEPYATLASLRAILDRHRNLQGIVRARDALELVRVGSDSGPETLLRLAMINAGLPEPDLQIKLWDRDDAPSADAGYRDRRIALQYDGAHHLDEVQRHSDRRRDRAFRDAGWTVLVFTQEDVADGFESATVLIKRALRTAWTDPSIESGFSSGQRKA
ncbi:hypothetical protein ABIB48_001861 [Arthrobacter sp. UYCu511]|uniref:DUF559 domain-containing protein n=1 Tax=unclassified Arthrobacter TaxID=235627 RepID=UPI0028F74C33|nr:DUF559 domain-containing protein [Arthrobacter sp. lap29]